MGSAVAIHLLSKHGWNAPVAVTIAGRRPVRGMKPVLREIEQVRSGKLTRKETKGSGYATWPCLHTISTPYLTGQCCT